MLELLCFDICSFAILITLLITVRSKGLTADRAGRRLLVLISVAILADMIEFSVTLLTFRPTEYPAIGFVLIGLFNFLHTSMLYLYASYIVALTGLWHRIGTQFIKSVRMVPVVLVIAVSIAAPYVGLFYGYSENGSFLRQPLYETLPIFSGIYSFYAIYFIWKNLKIMGWKKTITLSVCSMFSLVASYLQYTRPHLVVSILGFTLCIMVIIMFIDNPEDKIEDVSRLMNNTAYIEDLKVNFFTNKAFDILQINVRNNRVMDEMFNYEKYSLIIRTCSEKLKAINDEYKADASIYYLGDGRFRMVLDENDFDRTMEIAKGVVERFNGEINAKDITASLETSVNITQCQSDFNNLEDLLSFKNTASNYEKAGMITTSKDIIAADSFSIGNNIDKIIEKAIVNNSFRVFYQPIFSVEEGRFTYAEALIKIVDEDEGIIEPEVFLSTAEQNGAINEIGIYGIEEVCRLISSFEFKESGLSIIGINISAVQCLQKDLADKIFKIFKKYDVKPEQVCFEITESIASDNQKAFIENLHKLSNNGFRFALDNYGTGYSNIINLSSMPIDNVKFDRTFVNSENNSKIKVILENSIEMIKALDKKIIIVGVENEDSVRRFKEHNCEYLQGNYFAKAMEAGKLFEFLKDQSGERNAL